MSVATVPKPKALQCPNCAGTVELRGFGQSMNAVCIQCLSLIDVRDPGLRILQQFEEKTRRKPAIPLGARGTFGGIQYEAIGFQVRAIVVEETAYEWSEYLLYNPFDGYRYLTNYEGHWNDVQILRLLPDIRTRGKKSLIEVQGKTFKHFQSAEAQTMFVMGEFPWQVRVGERVGTNDFIAPPEVVSSEETADEVTWSRGTYVDPQTIWTAFSLAGNPQKRSGVYANEPNAYKGRLRSTWLLFLLLTVLLILASVLLYATNPSKHVFEQSYSYTTTKREEKSFVTPLFPLEGRASNVEIRIDTNLSNDWAFFGLALINDDTGVAFDVGKELGYYTGRDSDGDWSDGERTGRITIPRVPSGHYYLRVEPDMASDSQPHSVAYRIQVTRGVNEYIWLFLGLSLLLIPPVFTTARSLSFENKRWAESDYGPLMPVQSSEED